MAIVDMKRLRVLVMRKDQERLIRELQSYGCIEITASEELAGQPLAGQNLELAQTEEDLSRVRWAINKLFRYDKTKKSMLQPLDPVSPQRLMGDVSPEQMDLVRQVEQAEQKSGEFRGRQTQLQTQISQLAPWTGLSIPVEELRDTGSVRIFSGLAKPAALDELIAAWAGRPVSFERLSIERDSAYFIAYAHKQVADELMEALQGISFQQQLPPGQSGTPREQKDRYAREADALNQAIAGVDQEMTALSKRLPELRLTYEILAAKKARMEAEGKLAQTQSAALLTGWVPASAAEPLSKAIAANFSGAQAHVSDPEEGEEPPVLLRNSSLVRPYEAVVSGFALPDPGALDPTSVMMPFFACFFGMMVSDAGYGLMMAILIPILVKVMKPSAGGRKIFWILAGGGVATIFWGAMYNTWFGFGPWPSVFDPVNNSLPVMLLCVALGALHLFAGLALGAYQNIRAGKPLDALYDQGSWAMIVIGLGLLALPSLAVVGKWMAILGAVIVLLTAGRDKGKNPIKRLVSGLGALYGVTSWISDLLSYMRLFGMGLATGVIGMVINQLVGMIMSGGIIGIIIGAVIFVGAHLFNAAINILGAYVHACRLQYIEFFGKFYQEGGKAFQPLRYAPRYLRVDDTAA